VCIQAHNHECSEAIDYEPLQRLHLSPPPGNHVSWCPSSRRTHQRSPSFWPFCSAGTPSAATYHRQATDILPRALGQKKGSIARKQSERACSAFHTAVAPKPDSPALPTAGAPGRSLVLFRIVGPRAPARLKSPCCCHVAQQDWLGTINPYPNTQSSKKPLSPPRRGLLGRQ